MKTLAKITLVSAGLLAATLPAFSAAKEKTGPADRLANRPLLRALVQRRAAVRADGGGGFAGEDALVPAFRRRPAFLLEVRQQARGNEARARGGDIAVALGRLASGRSHGDRHAECGGVESVGAAGQVEDQEQRGQRPARQLHKPGTAKV